MIRYWLSRAQATSTSVAPSRALPPPPRPASVNLADKRRGFSALSRTFCQPTLHRERRSPRTLTWLGATKSHQPPQQLHTQHSHSLRQPDTQIARPQDGLCARQSPPQHNTTPQSQTHTAPLTPNPPTPKRTQKDPATTTSHTLWVNCRSRGRDPGRRLLLSLLRVGRYLHICRSSDHIGQRPCRPNQPRSRSDHSVSAVHHRVLSLRQYQLEHPKQDDRAE